MLLDTAKLTTRIDQLEREVRRLGNVVGGPGVTVQKSPGGLAISVMTPKAEPGLISSEVSGTALELNATQGTLDADTYDRATDNVPVSIQVVTDIRYDPTTHLIEAAYRTIVATGIKSVSAEPDWVEITEAVPCPAEV